MTKTIYETQSTTRLILTFSLPAILALIFEILTSVVDTIFAGNIKGQSNEALTMMGLLSPLFTLFVAFQTLFAFSTAIMISKYLGRGNKSSIHAFFQSGLLLTFIMSLIVSLLVYYNLSSILSFLGATSLVAEIATDYLTVILVSNIFSALGYTLTSAIRAFGNPIAEMVIVVIAVVANIFFNYLFTFVFSFGITGIAIGTLISESFCMILAIAYLKKKQLWFTFKFIHTRAFCVMGFKLFKIGFTQMVIQSLAGVTAFFFNAQLLLMGGNEEVAIWTVTNKIYIFLLMPIIGLTQAIQTIISYYYGKSAGEPIKEVVKKTMKFSFYYGLAMTFLIFFFNRKLLILFGLEIDTIETMQDLLRIVFSTFPFLGITFTIITLLQVTGKEFQALTLGLLRQVLLIVPLVLIIPFIFKSFEIMNIKPTISLFFAIPIADCITMGLALLYKRKLDSFL